MAAADVGSLGEIVDNGEVSVMCSLDNQGHCVLSNLAEVVERVLSFLPVKSLLRAACVCRLWRDCARRKLKVRQKISWISPTLHDDFGCTNTLVETVEEELENVYVLPETFLYITDYETFSGYNGPNKPKKAKKKYGLEVATALKNLLPEDCDILGLATQGVIVTPMGSASNRPKEMEYRPAGFGLILPKMNGVKIQQFHFLKDPKTKGFDESKLEEAGLKNNPDLRVVLIFGYNTWRQGDARFLNEVLNHLNEKSIIIAGGQIEYFLSFSSQMKSSGPSSIGAVGLAFSGPQIQAASVLLDHDVANAETADSAIQRLKAAHIPEENSVGLMFACIGRGEMHYKALNVEADLFRNHFPNVPLFGFFGNGEIGCDRVVSGNFTLRECNGEKDDLLHGYTTVMTIIHFGN
ncbi:F-box only protein 22 [Pelodytes ibericus]